MSNLISAAALSALASEQVRIIDCRFRLQDPAVGKSLYEQGRIPQAHFFDLDEDLSRQPAANGHEGRHPLPDIDALVRRLQEAGVSNDSLVVAYDDMGGLFAGRLWWLLKYLGHDRVQLLDGGIQAWQAAGYDLDTTVPDVTKDMTKDVAKGNFAATPRPEMVATIDEVKNNLDVPDVLLIDARAAERYRGDTEPLDKQAGHIPGAINLPFAGNLAGALEGGLFADQDALAARFADVQEAETVIAYCGSGVSAAHNVLAMDELGIKSKLYLGSWSDWSSRDDTPIATGEEP
jgi:thiosulfate/3-mercaptopyruvate sulfurtransferase